MHNKLVGITILVFGIFIGLTGIAYADPGVNATPETQSLSTVTTAEVVGLAMETDSGVWTLTNNPTVLYQYVVTGAIPSVTGNQLNLAMAQVQAAGGSLSFYPAPGNPGYYNISQINLPESLLNEQVEGYPVIPYTWQELLDSVSSSLSGPVITGKGIHEGILDPGQVQYTTAYDANIVAQGGKTSFIKQMNIDTRNKVASQSNVKARTELTFAATGDGGNVVGEENIMLDGAGVTTWADERMLCPFASDYYAYIPAFCNIVQSGSKYDLTIGSVTTSANERFVGTDSTDAVVMNYAINIKPYGTSQGQVPASGSAMAYIRAHVQESRDCYSCKAEDLTYTETASALGRITAFNKEMSYSSQVVGPLPTWVPVPEPDANPAST